MAVTNPYYEFTPAFVPGTKARAEDVNVQYQNIQSAFDILPGDADALTTDTAIFAPESGAGNAYVVTMPDTRTSNQDGDGIRFFATHTNTAAATLDVDGIGAVAFTNWDGDAFVGGEVISGRIYEVRYDATNTRFVLVATLDAALQVEWAEEWAINPEDVPVSVAAGGDGATTYSALHWAAKSLASAAAGRINADIITATPPTTEAVTALLEYWDLDDTDNLARIGFSGSNALFIDNLMHGGGFNIRGESNAGAANLIFFGDPDSSAKAYYAGSERFSTANDGLQLRAGSNDISQRVLVYAYTAGTARARIGHRGAGTFDIVNEIHGENVTIAAEDLAGTEQLLLTLDPDALAVSTPAGIQLLLPQENDAVTPTLAFGDGDTGIYESADDNMAFAVNGIAHWQMNANGSFYGVDANRPALLDESPSNINPNICPDSSDIDTGIGAAAANELSLIAAGKEMMRLDGTSSFERILGEYPLYLRERASAETNLADYGQFWVSSSIPNAPYFSDDADNTYSLGNNLYVVPGAELRLGAAGSGLLYLYSTTSTDTEPRYISFRHADATQRGYIGQVSSLMEIRNEIHGGNFRINLENAVGGVVQVLNSDPDGSFTISGDSEVRLNVGVSTALEPALIATENAGVTMYHNNIARLLTAAGGEVHIRRDDSNDTTDCYLGFAHANGVVRGWIGVASSGSMQWNSESHGQGFRIDGETAGGSAQQIFSASPGDNATIILSNGTSSAVCYDDRVEVDALSLDATSAAPPDVSGEGRIWLKDTEWYEELNFTDSNGTDFPIGFARAQVFATNAAYNFNSSSNARLAVNGLAFYNNSTAYTITLENSTGTKFPVECSFQVLVVGTGTITINEGTSTTLWLVEAGTVTDTAGGCTMGEGVATVYRSATGTYYIWGSGITA